MAAVMKICLGEKKKEISKTEVQEIKFCYKT